MFIVSYSVLKNAKIRQLVTKILYLCGSYSQQKKFMKRFFLIGILLLHINNELSAQTYDRLCELTFSAIEQDSLAQAENYIRQALQLDPSNPRNALLFSNLGTIQRLQNQYENALESYTYALNIAPLSVPILLNRATLYLQMGKEDKARVDYSLALDREPDNEEALLMRAYIYMQQRNYSFARADYEHLLKLNPLHYNGRLGLATLNQKEKRYEQALHILNDMISEKKDDALLYIARAGIENDMQYKELAIIDLEKAINLDNTQAEAYLMRGQIYLSQKKKILAKSDFETALQLGIPHSDLIELLQLCK